MRTPIYIFSVFSFALSICIGLLYRLQMTGLVDHFEHLDLRRVHTHIGFYLFLFPMVWITFKPTSWSPKSKILVIYLFIAFGALLSFLFLGYGLLSKILSGLVLLVWIFYAFLNLKKPIALRGWAHPFWGIILSALSIGLVIYFGVQNENQMVTKAVRMFMTCLIWGTFVPLCLEKIDYPKPNIILWVLFVLLTSIFVMDTSLSLYTFLGPIGLSLLLLTSSLKNPNSKMHRLIFYWFFAAIGLFLFGLGFLKNQHSVAVGGLHYIVLGPILQSIFNFDKYKFLRVYDLALFTMIMAITLPSFLPNYYLTLQLVTQGSSILLVVWLLTFLVRTEIFERPIKR